LTETPKTKLCKMYEHSEHSKEVHSGIYRIQVVSGLFVFQGGLKAVVWTDVFQSVIMLAGLIIIAVAGVVEVGSLRKVWEINKKHGRVNFFE